MASCKNDFLCTLQSEPLLIINLPLCPLFSPVITTKIVIELITLHYLANLKYKYIYIWWQKNLLILHPFRLDSERPLGQP